jgi:23S rRNA (cytosine1962-C5)-methyltransferase
VVADVLHTLPRPAGKRLAVRLTRDALRQVRGGHPWVYAPSITSVSHDGQPGDLAVVFDEARRFAAIGLWDPASPIRLRVLHHGRPATIDETWWSDRIGAALARRLPLTASGHTTGYRCVHGENDGFPGLVADRYGSTLVVKLYSAAWVPHLSTVVPLLRAQTATGTVVLRLSRRLQQDGVAGLADGIALDGTVPPAPVPFLEHGLRFEAEVVRGHKTGHFLDQRDNRALVRMYAAGARVLDVFSYTGGFSLYAAAGGATVVHSVDQSAPALDAARAAFARNRDDAGVRACRHTTAAGDAFEIMASLADRGERYDVVVVDPPSFAQKQADVAGALRAYRRLAHLAVRLTEPGGLLVQASCSSRITAGDFFAAVVDGARAAGSGLEEVARTGHTLDHPITFPEGAYLKALFARLAGKLD